ncbi:MAG TPA: RNA methyltransferase [Polyangiaceae bacterium]|nr:RNA methyltransferase [Polyangiaceae bacterium]
MRPPAVTSSEEGRLIAGLQPAREAIRAHGPRLRRVVLADEPGPRLEAVARFAHDQGVPRIERTSRAELDRLSGGATHQGVLCFAPPLELLPLETLLQDPRLLAIALDGIQDPQNFGALIRSAVGLAQAAVLWPEHASAPLSAATFRASAGAIEHARLCRVASLTNALVELKDAGVQVVGLDAQASVELRSLDLRLPTVLVIGAEHTGLGRAVRRACTHVARLVRPHTVDSLNASVAAGIAIYEATMQRSSTVASDISSKT